MRILSQDGKIDVNYDLGNLSIASGRCEDVERASIYFHSCSCPNATRLAEYTSVEKARKAMEMLHHMYTYGEEVELPEIDEKQFAEDDDIGLSNAIFYNKNRFFRVSKKYFQFPQDDEAEVSQ